ncbi:WAP four-disulfide core domain 1 [Chelydra serpentina]|uniref:WAP four-disulfide core domain protein 1 n=1 Tax=Chelydra serpentina TaxID=8475 RepID=A0A8T1TIM2_CHESE|nr:WAP four-disulfide core domain 1 [Chelydra serpentina]
MDSGSTSLVPKLHFCKKIFAAALCVSVLLPESGFAKNPWKRALHLKLAEKYDDYEYPLHSHSAHYQKNDRCPPPPQTLPERACEVPSCRSDSECERHKRCCYNGCIYACLESVQPPPVLDWLVQPKPRWLGGNGWLLDGPEEVLQAEACSTTEDGDEPLHCPTGYECHIINPGNTAEGIPNRGQCIKLRGNPDGHNLRHKYYKEYFGSNSNNVLGFVKQQQKHLG